MFPQDLIDAVCASADAAGITRSRLLALVEVETNGKTFEDDGRTPALLYERHVAYREANKRSPKLLAKFVRAGLAIPKWSRSTQYKDQGTSAGRLALIGRARGVDAEVANRSASWGAGQTMGFLAEELGFANACEMVERMTGDLRVQIDAMVRELENKRLVGPLNRGDWAKVAGGYNGAGYAANHYDTRLADADKRWQRKLALPAQHDPAPGLSRDEIKALQTKLRALGCASAGVPNGAAGEKTVAGLAQFQAREGLPVTGVYDEATADALRTAVPAAPTKDRERVTPADLKAAGSQTIKLADRGGLLGKAKVLFGGVLVAGGTAERVTGMLDAAQGGIDKVNQAKGVWQSLTDLVAPILADPAIIIAGAILIGSGVAVYFIAEAIKARRVADHVSGVHAGMVE